MLKSGKYKSVHLFYTCFSILLHPINSSEVVGLFVGRDSDSSLAVVEFNYLLALLCCTNLIYISSYQLTSYVLLCTNFCFEYGRADITLG